MTTAVPGSPAAYARDRHPRRLRHRDDAAGAALSLSLALIFALRMLGLFLVLPVFALEARKYPGGDDPALVGLAMGIYGLTQAVLQLPLGMASDRFGRKRVIVLGLLVFAAGSLLAALADSLGGLLLGRALQGAGAVSAAVTALLADQTRDGVRTKAMALVGGSIGLMFAVALVAAPPLAARFGLPGIFGLTCALALAGIAVVLWVVPPEPARHADAPRGRLADVLRHPDLLRLNLGVFALHTVQLAMWWPCPPCWCRPDCPRARTGTSTCPPWCCPSWPWAACSPWNAPAGCAAPCSAPSASCCWCSSGWAGRRRPARRRAVGPGRAAVPVLLRLQRTGSQPAQPRLAHRAAGRCAALGTYNTLQSLGLFAGGALVARCCAGAARMACSWRLPCSVSPGWPRPGACSPCRPRAAAGESKPRLGPDHRPALSCGAPCAGACGSASRCAPGPSGASGSRAALSMEAARVS